MLAELEQLKSEFAAYKEAADKALHYEKDKTAFVQKKLGSANASKKYSELLPGSRARNTRMDALVSYIQNQTGDDFSEFIRDMLQHEEVAAVIQDADSKTPEDMALICIGAQLTHDQFDYLCKKRVLKDTSFNSKFKLSEGFDAVQASIPEIKFLCRPFSGCCFDPYEYLSYCLNTDFSRLEFRPGKETQILVIVYGQGMGPTTMIIPVSTRHLICLKTRIAKGQIFVMSLP